MNNKLSILKVLLFVVTIGITSCTEENTDCNKNDCINGDCVSGNCVCNAGYTGENCNIQITPSSIRISNIKIIKFPAFNGTATWDATDGPDLKVALKKNNTTIYTQSNPINNAVSGQSYSVSLAPSLVLTSVTTSYTLVLYDNDIIYNQDADGNPTTVFSDTDTFMTGLTFDIYNEISGFPSTLVVSGSNASYELSLNYTW